MSISNTTVLNFKNYYEHIKSGLFDAGGYNSFGTTLFSDWCVPTGTVLMLMRNSVPSGYLACDGTQYNIASYPQLAEFFKVQFGSYNYFGGNGTTTFAVPDLRGEYLIGAGYNGHPNQGPGATVGVHEDATQLNAGWANNSESGYSFEEVPSATYRSIACKNQHAWNDTRTATVSLRNTSWKMVSYDDGEGVWNYGVRPDTVSVLYVIAAKDIRVNAKSDYSTDEKIVGAWYDGKTLYQKTFVYDQAASGGTLITLGTLAFAESCFVLNGFVVYSGTAAGSLTPGDTVPINFCERNVSNYNYSIWPGFYKDTKEFKVQLGSGMSISKCVCTVRYTKAEVI